MRLVFGQPCRRVDDQLLIVFGAPEEHQAVTIHLLKHRHPLGVARGGLIRLSRHDFVIDVERGFIILHLLARLALPHVGVDSDTAAAVFLEDGIESFGRLGECLFALRIFHVGIRQSDGEVDCRALELRAVPGVDQLGGFPFGPFAAELLLAGQQFVHLRLVQGRRLLVLGPGVREQFAGVRQHRITFRLVAQREAQHVLGTVERNATRGELGLRRRLVSGVLFQELVEQPLRLDEVLQLQVDIGRFLGRDAQTRRHLQIVGGLQVLRQSRVNLDLFKVEDGQFAVPVLVQSVQEIEERFLSAAVACEQPQHQTRRNSTQSQLTPKHTGSSQANRSLVVANDHCPN